jgi:hypothetical protein
MPEFLQGKLFNRKACRFLHTFVFKAFERNEPTLGQAAGSIE